MKNNILYIAFIIISSFLLSCKSEPFSSSDKKGSLESDRFILPSLPGDYEPKGLRKVSIMEMKALGENLGIPTDIVYRNAKGVIVTNDYYGQGQEPRYVQFYANQAGKIEAAVVYDMTPEIKAMMMLMRMATQTLAD